MPHIQLTADDLAQAEAYAHESFRSTVNRRQVSHAQQQRDIRVGKLGELAFLRYLQKNGKAVRGTELMFVNTPDGMDFATGSGETIDIKTASRDNHRRILVPTSQLRREPKDFYVGVRVNEDTLKAEVVGYTTATALAKEGIFPGARDYPAYAMALSKLSPIEGLLERMPDTNGDDGGGQGSSPPDRPRSPQTPSAGEGPYRGQPLRQPEEEQQRFTMRHKAPPRARARKKVKLKQAPGRVPRVNRIRR